MATAGSGSGGGPGPGPVPGAGSRKGSVGRDAEAEVWGRRVRELAKASPANRLCFECGQRGVTYVDVTVGSFVCTACSGALRGLNPPHRVKSISMTTFTEPEVLFLQARGNEACRRVWLGTMEPRTCLLPDPPDPQRVKEFLQEKYEKRRWYVAPEQSKPPQSSSAPTQPLLGDTGTQPRPAPQRPPEPARKASTDLLADIGGDPFATPQPAPGFAAFPGVPGPAPPPAAPPSFNAFGPSPAPTFGGAPPTGGAAARGVATSVPPPEGGASASSLFGPPPVLPPQAYGGYTNPFVTPRPSTNPFQPNGPGTTFTSPPLSGAFSSPFQADGSAFSGFSIAKASTNPFLTHPASTPPFGIKHPTTNPFL